MRLKPRNQYLTVEPISDKLEKSEGGVFLPDSAKEYPLTGVVLDVGGGSLDVHGARVPHRVKSGDLVLYTKHSGTKLETDDGSTVLLMEASDVLAII